MNPRPNPYVGPRAFQPGEPFYGRDRELRLLSALLVAERIVLLHSPSGAGKTSLVQAGLLPRLAAEGFTILPTIRVNQEPPEGAAAVPGFNRYTLSTLLALEEGLPDEQRLPVIELAALTLDEYLTRRPRAVVPDSARGPETASVSDVLIFDQFEEVLTIAPTDREGKQAFFEQLGQALRNKQRWALVSIREDYLGALAPFTRPIPGRFAATFRLDLLGVDGALQAIQKPAQAQGVDFTASAAHKLVDDLRRVHVQLPDGSLEEQLGPHVEPVQLQVVCFRLWQGLEEADKGVDEKDLAGVGDVNRSLADYYASSVKAVAGQGGASERLIREWFDRQLITPEGIRGQVLMGAESSVGLPNAVVRRLEDAHIIRGEKRAGKSWYELSHDRMIKPVRDDNAAWFAANLSLFQQQATLWAQQGRPEGMLLRGKELDAAEKKAQVIHLNEDESAFLAACRKLRETERREKLRTRLIQALAVGALIAMIAAVNFGTRALAAQRQAEQSKAGALSARDAADSAREEALHQRDLADANAAAAVAAQATAVYNAELASANANLAKARELAAQAVLHKDDFFHPELSFLLAAEAYQHLDQIDTRNALLSTALSPQYNPLAGFLYLPAGESLPFGGEMTHSDIQALAADPAGKLVVAGRQDGSLVVWDLQTRAPVKIVVAHPFKDPVPPPANGKYEELQLPNLPLGGVRTLAYSPDGKFLVSGGWDGKIIFWEAVNFTQARSLNLKYIEGGAAVRKVLFSPDGQLLAAAMDNCPSPPCVASESISIYHADSLEPVATLDNGDLTYDLDFSPDGQTLAATAGNQISLWDTHTWQKIGALSGHTSAVLTVAFNPDGKTLVSGGYDHTLRAWDLATSRQIGDPLWVAATEPDFPKRQYPVTQVKFSPDGRFLLAGVVTHLTLDFGLTDILLYDARTYQPIGEHWHGHFYALYDLAFGPDSLMVYSGGEDAAIHIWNIGLKPEFSAGRMRFGYILSGHTDLVNSLAFSPDGKVLASCGADGVLRLWDLASRTQIGAPFTGHAANIRTLAFSPDGRLLASGGDDATLRFWDVATHQQVGEPINYPAEAVLVVKFAPDGKTLLSSGYKSDRSEKTIRVWEVATHQQVGEFAGHERQVLSLAFSPDGKTLASGASDKTIRFWDLATRQPIGEPIQGNSSVTGLAFSPDGQWLVSAHYQDRFLMMWDAQTHQPIGAPLTNTLSSILTVAVSPDGKMIASGAWDFLVRLWDVGKQREIGNPLDVAAGHRDGVNSVVFSPDGKWVASASYDATIRLWTVDPQEWLKLDCELASRNFTLAEWQEWLPNEPYRATCPQWAAGQ